MTFPMDTVSFTASPVSGGTNLNMSTGLPPQAAGGGGSLEHAVKAVDKSVGSDGSFPTLADQLHITVQGGCSVSGLSDHDYPNLAAQGVGLEALKHFSVTKKIPIPPELREHHGNMQCNSIMGLFPEIGRAWMTVDSDIFVWTYEDGGDLAYYDGLNESIVAVELVNPREKVFQSHIRYLLCLATPIEIVLLGVTFQTSSEGSMDGDLKEMHLLPEPLFTIPSDNMHFLCIYGTPSGRIFLGGRDGCIYEIRYQASEGWFTRRCKKINHSMSALSWLVPNFLSSAFTEPNPIIQLCGDHSRNTLYALSEKGSIHVYDLGEDGEGFSKICCLGLSTIVHEASSAVRTVDESNFRSLVRIQEIGQEDSPQIHLMAVTETGVRLYFATSPLNMWNRRPSTLFLVHVRLPPGLATTFIPQRPRGIHLSYAKNGTCMHVASVSETSEMLWFYSPQLFAIHMNLCEAVETVTLDGGVIMAVSEETKIESCSIGRRPPMLVAQHIHPQRRFIFLSLQGATIVTQLRPVDQLRNLLLSGRGADSAAVKAFFSLLTPEEACSTALSLICSNQFFDDQVVEWSKRAFFLYGREPVMGPGNLSYIGPGGVSSPITSSLFQPGSASTPVHASMGRGMLSLNPPSQPTGSLGFSAKHSALYRYFGRLVRPLWHAKVCEEFLAANGKHYLSIPITSGELTWVMEQLEQLSVFVRKELPLAPLPRGQPPLMHSESPLMGRLGGGTSGGILRRPVLNGTAGSGQGLDESSSLQDLEALVVLTKETLGLWRILSDHQFYTLAEKLTQENQKQLQAMTFRDLIFNGQDITNALIQVLVNCYLGDNAAVDSVIVRLRDICPHIYRDEDAKCAKATELLAAAKNCAEPYQQNDLISSAIKLCMEVAGQLDMGQVARHLVACRSFTPVVHLCSKAALDKDPQSLALTHFQEGLPLDSPLSRDAFARRQDSYKVICEVLGQLLQATGTLLSPDAGTQADFMPQMSPTEAQDAAEEMVKTCLEKDDELLHIALYTWLIDHHLSSILLQLECTTLEPFLQRAASNVVQILPQVTAMDLLAKYYEKHERYLQAAKVLSRLTERHGTDVTLEQRLDYLTRALLCIRCAGGGAELLHELEDKMDVARLQDKILGSVKQLPPSPAVEDAIRGLNSDLLSVMELYSEYAVPLSLWECQLAIIHCAGYQDSHLISDLWMKIFHHEFSLSETEVPETRIPLLKEKLISLGKKYRSPEIYFPLGFILGYLEERALEEGLTTDPAWIWFALHEAGIPMSTILNAYNSLLGGQEGEWGSGSRRLHLARAMVSLMEAFARNPSLAPLSDRQAIKVSCLDCVNRFIVDLQFQEHDGDGSGEVMQQLRNTQHLLLNL